MQLTLYISAQGPGFSECALHSILPGRAAHILAAYHGITSGAFRMHMIRSASPLSFGFQWPCFVYVMATCKTLLDSIVQKHPIRVIQRPRKTSNTLWIILVSPIMYIAECSSAYYIDTSQTDNV